MQKLISATVLVSCAMIAGCHDGPLYALKTINPVYLSEWKKDEALGPTDVQRREELQRLVYTMPSMQDSDQTYWLGHIEAILDNDKNPEMRTLAVRALEGCRSEGVYPLCEKSLTDESTKVRMAVCDVLAARDEPKSAQMLGKMIGSESNEDVMMAAISAVGKHRSAESAQLLKNSLKSRNPAVRVSSMEALAKCTGKDFGEDPAVWVAFLDGEEVKAEKKSLTKQMKDLF